MEHLLPKGLTQHAYGEKLQLSAMNAMQQSTGPFECPINMTAGFHQDIKTDQPYSTWGLPKGHESRRQESLKTILVAAYETLYPAICNI